MTNFNITSVKHLSYILKCKSSEQELNSICTYLIDKERKYDDKFYREIIKESEKKGKVSIRRINPSKGRLHLIQSKIKTEILDKIFFPSYVQGANKGFSNITNANLHKGKKYKFTTDIKKFFPSIGPSQVYKAFTSIGMNPEIARILTILTTYKGKIPQGASTSAHVANLVFSPIDTWIYAFCQNNNLTYSRYIDDISLSSQIDFKDHLSAIINKIIESGFIISSPKTQYKHILEITGITVGNNTIKPNQKFYIKLEEEQSEASKIGRLNYLKRVKES